MVARGRNKQKCSYLSEEAGGRRPETLEFTLATAIVDWAGFEPNRILTHLTFGTFLAKELS
jgi:hypothetical protein